jgi:hypothetical protein
MALGSSAPGRPLDYFAAFVFPGETGSAEKTGRDPQFSTWKHGSIHSRRDGFLLALSRRRQFFSKRVNHPGFD